MAMASEIGDLTDEELGRVASRPCCAVRPCTDYGCRAVREILDGGAS